MVAFHLYATMLYPRDGLYVCMVCVWGGAWEGEGGVGGVIIFVEPQVHSFFLQMHSADCINYQGSIYSHTTIGWTITDFGRTSGISRI